MKFWDSSAVVCLLTSERNSDFVRDVLKEDQSLCVWWFTELECLSAIKRRVRSKELALSDADACCAMLDALKPGWHEIDPSDSVKTHARRFLNVHDLRSADALQLAAAFIAAEYDPPSLEFVCFDERLNQAAKREGFKLISA